METKNNTTNTGKHYELKAIQYLQSNKFQIIEINYFAKKLGEIDIIAKKNDVYHFVEVKSGKNFEAVYNITPSKLRKLYRSIELYLKHKNLDVSYCIDAIIFAGVTQLLVNTSDDNAEDLCNKMPSSTSNDYGKPFADIFKDYDYDFFKIDANLFSPSKVIISNMKTGNTFTSGAIDNKLMKKSFGI